MNKQNESDLVSHLDRALKNLPQIKAPATLTPRVMAAIQIRQHQAWWHQSFWRWPRSMQCLAILVFGPMCLGFVWLTGQIQFSMIQSIMPPQLNEYYEVAVSLCKGVVSLARASHLVASSLMQPGLILLTGVFFFFYLSCLGMGTLFYRCAYRQCSR